MPKRPQVVVIDGSTARADVVAGLLTARGVTHAREQIWSIDEDSTSLTVPRDAVVLLTMPDSGEAGATVSPAVGAATSDAALMTESPIRSVLDRLVRDGVPTVVWGASEDQRRTIGALTEFLSAETSADEVAIHVAALTRYAPQVKRLELELGNLQRLGTQLNKHFSEIDQELRLAGRLQRDFLPKQFPECDEIRFACLYRPATWVSGDMYDVFRIDEDHLGVFMSDAMGHGIAAGMLTMFLRQAVRPKRVSGKCYTIAPPAEVMAELNTELVKQELPHCQFVTAVYAVINTKTREARIARGGHPAPLHIDLGGEIHELSATGNLLGVPDLPPEFDEDRLTLEPGEKLYLYTDGVEHHFVEPEHGTPAVFTDKFRGWRKLSVQGLVDALGAELDNAKGSLHPEDDVTVLGIEFA